MDTQLLPVPGFQQVERPSLLKTVSFLLCSGECLQAQGVGGVGLWGGGRAPGGGGGGGGPLPSPRILDRCLIITPPLADSDGFSKINFSLTFDPFLAVE